MQDSTRLFPAAAVGFTGQSLVSHAGTTVLTEFLDALGFGRLCEDRLGQFVPSGARHRPGRLIGSLAVVVAARGGHFRGPGMLRPPPRLFWGVASNATGAPFFLRARAHPG